MRERRLVLVICYSFISQFVPKPPLLTHIQGHSLVLIFKKLPIPTRVFNSFILCHEPPQRAQTQCSDLANEDAGPRAAYEATVV